MAYRAFALPVFEATVAAPALPMLLVPAAVALIAWRFYSRARRMIGRQRLTDVRPWISVCLFPLLLAFMVFNSIHHQLAVLAIAAGIAVGLGLALYGLRLTRFERTPEGFFYTPSAHIGIALMALLVIRIAYRVVQGYLLMGSGRPPPPPDASNPLTLLLFAMLAAYYITYSAGLLRWRHRPAGSDLSDR